MEGLLEYDSLLSGRHGKLYQIGRVIGQTGEAEYYDVLSDGMHYTLKCYYSMTASTDQLERLQYLLEIDPPSVSFLWPIDLISIDSHHFAYVMKSLTDDYEPLLTYTKERNLSFSDRCLTAFHLSQAFYDLHQLNLYYEDISLDQIYVNKKEGRVSLDSVDHLYTGVIPMRNLHSSLRLKAPELLAGRSCPCVESDRYTLSVLIFYLFVGHHPLEGKMEEGQELLEYENLLEFYMNSAVYMFDEENMVNRPCRRNQLQIYSAWKSMPSILKERLNHSFLHGRILPAGRIRDEEWMDLMGSLLNHTISCPHCQSELYYQNSLAYHCPHCQAKITPYPSLRIGSEEILLSPFRKIYEHSVRKNYHLDSVMATVVQHPRNPRLWGIRNDSDRSWIYYKPNGEAIEVKPAQSAGIATGAEIGFQDLIGRIL